MIIQLLYISNQRKNGSEISVSGPSLQISLWISYGRKSLPTRSSIHMFSLIFKIDFLLILFYKYLIFFLSKGIRKAVSDLWNDTCFCWKRYSIWRDQWRRGPTYHWTQVSDQYWSPLFAKKGSFHINIWYSYFYLSKELMYIKICYNRIFIEFIEFSKFISFLIFF